MPFLHFAICYFFTPYLMLINKFLISLRMLLTCISNTTKVPQMRLANTISTSHSVRNLHPQSIVSLLLSDLIYSEMFVARWRMNAVTALKTSLALSSSYTCSTCKVGFLQASFTARMLAVASEKKCSFCCHWGDLWASGFCNSVSHRLRIFS